MSPLERSFKNQCAIDHDTFHSHRDPVEVMYRDEASKGLGAHWFATSGVPWVKSETRPVYGGKEGTKKEAGHSRLVCAKFHKQENFIRGLSWETTR